MDIKALSIHLNHCQQLALLASEKGNPAVGALVVRAGVVVGAAEEAGRSKNDVTCHAEIEAIRAAVEILQSNDLSDCQLITTHEPCVMCAYVIRYHQIQSVYYAHKVFTVGSIHSSHPILTDASFWPEKSVPEVHFMGEMPGF